MSWGGAMGRPSESTIKRLYALSGNLCAFPGCTALLVEDAGTSIGEICHIRSGKPKGPRFDRNWPAAELDGFDNLIVLCPTHHTIIDKRHKQFPAEVLEEMKAVHQRANGRPERADDVFAARILLRIYDRISVTGDNANIVVGSPGAVVGQTIHVRTVHKTIIQPPPGTIGADAEASRYIRYLIDRYNKLAGANKNRSRAFSPAAISKTIESNFRSPWRLLSMEDFASVAGYLQQRISRTRIAKYNAAKGHRSYSTFAEFSQSRRRDG